MMRCSILLCLILSFACFATSESQGQEITIGVPLVDPSLNIVESDNPFAQFILHGTTQPLLRVDSSRNNKIQMVLADSFSTSQDGKTVELRLRAGASFINSKMLDEDDLSASLDRCVSEVTSGVRLQGDQAPGFKVYTKDQRTYVSVTSKQDQSSLFSFLSNCPILESRSLRLFGEDLGSANLLLGTGPFQVVLRTKNREARLERVNKTNVWAAALMVRGFADSLHALTALRTGTIDAIYAQDLEVVSKASNDPTLLIHSCGVYNIILRKGLEISCFSIQDPGSLKYTAL